MKRIISVLLIFVLLFASSCKKAEQQPYNLEVTAEPFESMEIHNSYTDHKTYNSEQELYDDSDLVFIGMPIETFTDGEQIFFNREGQRVSKENSDATCDYYTVRDVQIIELIKGEAESDVIKVADMAIVKQENNEKESIIGLPTSATIAKKNVKYIYYVYKSASSDYYYVNLDQGLINVDGLDSRESLAIEEGRLGQVKDRFLAQFEKYDRTAELSTK